MRDNVIGIAQPPPKISREIFQFRHPFRMRDREIPRQIVRQIVDLVVLLENTVAKKRAAA